jgi:adenylate/nucleoside-diphosphate kinase
MIKINIGYKRLKYPTINCKETALKFIAISLKACNPNKDEVYRQKYKQKLQLFLKNCAFAGEIKDEN